MLAAIRRARPVGKTIEKERRRLVVKDILCAKTPVTRSLRAKCTDAELERFRQDAAQLIEGAASLETPYGPVVSSFTLGEGTLTTVVHYANPAALLYVATQRSLYLGKLIVEFLPGGFWLSFCQGGSPFLPGKTGAPARGGISSSLHFAGLPRRAFCDLKHET